MPCKILIANFTKAPWYPGCVVAVLPEDSKGGKKQVLPNWLTVTITDASRSEMGDLLYREWHTGVFRITDETDQFHAKAQIRIEMAPSLISASGINSEVPAEVRTYLAEALGAETVTYDTTYSIMSVDKSKFNLQEIRDDLSDMFRKRRDIRMRYIDPEEVKKLIELRDPKLDKKQLALIVRNRLDE